MTICIMRNNSECALLYVSVKKDCKNLYDKYVQSINSHNNEIITSEFPNAGFDLFCPEDTESIGAQKVVLDHKIKCCMRVVGENEQFVSYYLYSRSSLPLKTPLRLANNVGIIDSGYRGNIKGVFDNIQGYDFMDYIIEFGTRLLQICPPNLEYPMKIIIVDNLSHLGETERGEGGFGSTGN